MKSSGVDFMCVGGEERTGDDYLAWLRRQWPSAFLPQLGVKPTVAIETLDPDQSVPALHSLHHTVQFNFMLRLSSQGKEDGSPGLLTRDDEYHCDNLFRESGAYPTRGLTLILWNIPPPKWSNLHRPWESFVQAKTRQNSTVPFALPELRWSPTILQRSGDSSRVPLSLSLTQFPGPQYAPPVPVVFRAHDLPFALHEDWFTEAGTHLTHILFTMLGHHARSLSVLQPCHQGAFSVDWALFNRLGLSLLSEKRHADVYMRVPSLDPVPYLSTLSLYQACTGDEAAASVWSNPGAFISLVGALSQARGLIWSGKTLWEWIQGLNDPSIYGIVAEVATWPLSLQACIKNVVMHLVGREQPPVVDPYRYALLRVIINLPQGTLAALPPDISSAEVWSTYSAHFASCYSLLDRLSVAPVPPDAHPSYDTIDSTIIAHHSLLDCLRREAHHLSWFLSYKDSGPLSDPCYATGEDGMFSVWGWPYDRPLWHCPRLKEHSAYLSDYSFWTRRHLVPAE